MLQTVHGILKPDGNIQMLEPIAITTPVPVLITVLREEEGIALMSEYSLAKDWLREEEEEAWLHLQQA